MPRPRRDYLRKAHWLVQDWSEWMECHVDSSAIGYPRRTAESSAGQGRGSNKPGSICPEVIMPQHVATVDKAIRQMPTDLNVVVIRKYRQGIRVSRRKLDEALIWLSGRITY